MASKTEIANRTLIKLGQSRVSNIDTDTSTAAVTLSQLWDSVRDSTLQMYPWNFATKRADLVPDSVSPSWGYSTAFSIPSDFLQLLEIKDDIDYKIEGNKILCDQSDIIYIKYIRREDDVSMYPPIFVEMLSQNLAIESCDRIADDTNLKAVLIQQSKDLREKVLATDSVENLPVEVDEDDWVTVRS